MPWRKEKNTATIDPLLLATAYCRQNDEIMDTDCLAHVLTDQERQFFNTHGYLVIPNALDATTTSRLVKVVDRVDRRERTEQHGNHLLSVTDIVAEDEREGNKRRILNFGHTIGHALETHFGFNTLRHGEAIAYGMLAAGKLSNEDYSSTSSPIRLKIEDLKSLEQSIRKLPIPKLPEFDPNDILKIMQNDKKVKDGKLHFVLLEEIGKAIIVDDVEEKTIINAMECL